MPSELPHHELNGIILDVLSVDHFRTWVKKRNVARALGEFVFGEIYWHKSIGRPNSETLAEAFHIHSLRSGRIIVGTPEGLKAKDVNIPHEPSWFDGKDDDTYWRVNYLISGIPLGHRKDPIFGNYSEVTLIEPTFVKGVTWSVPGGPFSLQPVSLGPRAIHPVSAAFVKEERPIYISFEVKRRSLLTFDSSGIVNP